MFLICDSMKLFLSVIFKKKPLFAGSPFPAYARSIFSIASFDSASIFATIALAMSRQETKPKEPVFLN